MTASRMLTALIADDEELARRRMKRLLEDADDIEIVSECTTAVEVLQALAKEPVDLLFLDIHMPGMSGIEALMLLPEPRPYVIFCTAHAEHALSAFDVGAVDYLLKPIESERLDKALARARHAAGADPRDSSAGEANGAPESAPFERLPIATKTGIFLVSPEDVVSAVLEGELVRVRTSKGDFLSDDSLQALGGKLPGSHFYRVHRRAIVNLKHVVRLEPLDTGGYVAHTSLGDGVEVSRQAARLLRRRLGLRRSDDDR